ETGCLLDRQRVHVGAQAHLTRAAAAPKLADQAGAAEAALDLVTPALQPLGHQVAGALFLEGQFGVLVNVAPDADEFLGMGAHGLQGVVGGHGELLLNGYRETVSQFAWVSHTRLRPAPGRPAPSSSPARHRSGRT